MGNHTSRGIRKYMTLSYNRFFTYESKDRVWGNPLGRIKRCVFKIDTQYARLRKDLPEDKKREVMTELVKRGLL